MKIFQRFILLLLLFGAINMMHSADKDIYQKLYYVKHVPVVSHDVSRDIMYITTPLKCKASLANHCHCHEDCEALTSVINQQNQLRRQPGPDKEFIQNETDTSTCKRNTKCCVPTCPKGWIMDDASCLLFLTCTPPCSHDSVRDTCSEKWAHLAKVPSATQVELFFRSLNEDIIIAAGNDSAIEETDGSLKSDGYSNGKKAGEPDGNAEQSCVVLYRDVSKWYTVQCGTPYGSPVGYICETSLT